MPTQLKVEAVQLVRRIIASVDSRMRVIERLIGGAGATVANSDASFSQLIPDGETLVVEDIAINVYVNGTLNQTATHPALIDFDINISA